MKRAMALLLFGVLIISGCATSKIGIKPGLLEPQSQLRFVDIPAPRGFKFMAQASYFFENYGMRAAVLKYKGRATLDQVVNFYKEQMLLNNWNLLNIVEYGDRIMTFDRENEICTITLVPKAIGWNNIVVTISVGPKSQTGKPAENPVK